MKTLEELKIELKSKAVPHNMVNEIWLSDLLEFIYEQERRIRRLETLYEVGYE